MINPARVAAILCGAVLWVVLIYGGRDLALAGPLAMPNETATALSGADQPNEELRGRAYLFRGALGPIFSRGMDSLTEKLEDAGIEASVYEFTICQLIAARALREYRENPAPIILIGHSMGGLCAVKFAEILGAEGIRVSLVVTIDPAHVTPDVPLNIDRFINIFLSKDVLGGGDVKPKPGYHGHYASFDLSQRKEVLHINIEKNDTIQEQLVTKVLQLTTAKGEGDPVPLRYVVPSGTPIELWDSGMPVFARPGDTLQSIAAAYHVPLWSITQMNKGPDSTPLVPGERIVVPRRLTPLVEVSAQPASSPRDARAGSQNLGLR